MAELTVNQLIKIIIGSLVFVAVVAGVYMIFKDKFMGFFDSLSVDFFRSILRS